MVDETNNSDIVAEEDNVPTEAAEVSDFQPISSQDELDVILGARLARERKKFADYDELKSASSELADLRAEVELERAKATADLDGAVARAEAAELRAVRAEVAAESGVPAKLLTGSTEEEIRASADSLLEFKGKGGAVIPTQGVSPETPAGAGDWLRARLNA